MLFIPVMQVYFTQKTHGQEKLKVYFTWSEIPVLWDEMVSEEFDATSVMWNWHSYIAQSSELRLCWKSCSLIHEANYLLVKPLTIKAHSALQTLISVNTVVLTGSKQSGVGQHTCLQSRSICNHPQQLCAPNKSQTPYFIFPLLLVCMQEKSSAGLQKHPH